MERVLGIDYGDDHFDEFLKWARRNTKTLPQARELQEIKTIWEFKNHVIRDAMEENLKKKKTVDRLAAYIPKKKRSIRVEIPLEFDSSHPNLNIFPRKFWEEEEQKIMKKKKKVSRKRGFEAENGQEKNTKKLKKTKKIKDMGPPPDMPVELRREIETKGGDEIKLVIMKELFKTDLNPHHDRLSIPIKQVRDPSFLNDEEKNMLKPRNGRIPVKLMEPCGHVSDIKFTKWEMENTSNYALNSSWKSIFLRQENQDLNIFKEMTIIQIWSFRINQQLWFTINKVRDGIHNEDAAGSCSATEGEASSSHSSSIVHPEHD